MTTKLKIDFYDKNVDKYDKYESIQNKLNTINNTLNYNIQNNSYNNEKINILEKNKEVIEKKNEIEKDIKKKMILYGTYEDNKPENKYNMSFTMRRNFYLNNLLARIMAVFHSAMRNLFLISNVGIVFYGFSHNIKNKNTSIIIKIISLITLLLGLFYIYTIYIEYMLYYEIFTEHKEIVLIASYQGINNYKYIVIFYATILSILILVIVYNLISILF